MMLSGIWDSFSSVMSGLYSGTSGVLANEPDMQTKLEEMRTRFERASEKSILMFEMDPEITP